MLVDSNENLVMDSGIVAPPVFNVLFNSQLFGGISSDGYDLLPVGEANEDNIFRFDPTSSQWTYNLGTKQFVAPHVLLRLLLP